MASGRVLRPLFYTTAAVAAGGTVIYVSYRPRNIPGLEDAAVPPPTYSEGGVFRPPNFPAIKSREDQIADLKRSSGSIAKSVIETAKSGFGSFFSSKPTTGSDAAEEAEPYDILIIGCGATGSGIALDAATRGLRVAVVERDDFSSGTSSKSTKLVHGGVRYLEKAFMELDYNQ